MYAVEINSGCMLNMPSFVKIGTGVQAILRYYWWKRFMMYAVEMNSGGML
jgi:hypothetical protein